MHIEYAEHKLTFLLCGPDTMNCALFLIPEHFESSFLTLKTGPSVWEVLQESQIYPMNTQRYQYLTSWQ